MKTRKHARRSAAEDYAVFTVFLDGGIKHPYVVFGDNRVRIEHARGCPDSGWGQFDGAHASSLGGGEYSVGPMVVTVQPCRQMPYSLTENWEPIPSKLRSELGAVA